MKIIVMTLSFLLLGATGNAMAQDWPSLWKSYVAGFQDNQVRVIDHDAGDRTTSEGQAYAMFFALVANDRSRFDGLLHWTEANLASGDLSSHLPAWSWGRNKNNQWGVTDPNSASDADLWMAYTLLEAGDAWHESRYTSLGTSLAERIASSEVAQIPGLGTMLLPGATGFRHGDVYRLNASYLPLQLLSYLGQKLPNGPWQQIAAQVPAVVRGSSPSGFASDWVEFRAGNFTPSPLGSYDAIRVYLWSGMLNPSATGRDELLKLLPGMARYLHSQSTPPAKVSANGSVVDPKGPVGFSAALVPYLSALGENKLEADQSSRVQAELNSKTGLVGNPAKYFDENLVLFALGFKQRQFWFDSQGHLQLAWKNHSER